jgi:hypothetical protein
MKRKYPLVFMPPENDILETMSLMNSLKMNESIQIINVGHEVEPKDEYKPILIDEPSKIHGRNINMLALLATTALSLELTKKQDKVTVIDGVEYSEKLGNLFPIKNYHLHAEQSLLEDFDFKNKDLNSPKLSTAKKNRKQNNRKVKKRKKAKNGK